MPNPVPKVYDMFKAVDVEYDDVSISFAIVDGRLALTLPFQCSNQRNRWVMCKI